MISIQEAFEQAPFFHDSFICTFKTAGQKKGHAIPFASLV